MDINRVMRSLPWVLMVIGIVVKTSVLLVFHFGTATWISRVILSSDPIGLSLAEKITSILFDQRGIAPSPAESITFEILLVILFGVECVLVGWLIATLSQRLRAKAVRPLPGKPG